MRLVKLLTIVVLLSGTATFARVFFTGSNPALSSIVFPQDNLLIPGGDHISYSTTWQSFPWWGDIDSLENKPNNEYVLNRERSSEQQYSAGMNEVDHMVSVSRWLKGNRKLRFDLKYLTKHFNAQANGLNYSYDGRHKMRELYLITAYATRFKGRPAGLRLGLGGINTSRPDVEHIVVTGTGFAESNLIIWGWKGSDHQPVNDFYTGNPLKFDLQGAMTFGPHKMGSRIRYYFGKLNHFRWNEDDGTYHNTDMKMHNYTLRLYGIYNWYTHRKFRFNTTALTRLTMLDSVEILQGSSKVPDNVARAKQFVIQVNPNVNIFPWKYPMTYIDAAVLCNYQFTRYEYLYRGEYRSSSVRSLDQRADERFSYGNEQFFEMALDMYASIPVFGMKNQSAAIGVSVLVWRKYKWLTKYFGRMNGDEFEASGMRKNFDKEMWLNSLVNLIYRRGKVMYRIDFGQPLIYSLTPKTVITDADGRIDRSLAKEKMWLAQSGYRVGFFVSTGLENFMKYQPLARPDF